MNKKQPFNCQTQEAINKVWGRYRKFLEERSEEEKNAFYEKVGFADKPKSNDELENARKYFEEKKWTFKRSGLTKKLKGIKTLPTNIQELEELTKELGSLKEKVEKQLTESQTKPFEKVRKKFGSDEAYKEALRKQLEQLDADK